MQKGRLKQHAKEGWNRKPSQHVPGLQKRAPVKSYRQHLCRIGCHCMGRRWLWWNQKRSTYARASMRVTRQWRIWREKSLHCWPLIEYFVWNTVYELSLNSPSVLLSSHDVVRLPSDEILHRHEKDCLLFCENLWTFIQERFAALNHWW